MATAVPKPQVPAILNAPDGHVVLLRALGKGVQIYDCKPGAAVGSSQWVLRAPDAVLTDYSGEQVAKHFAGPTWEGEDGSQVVGEVLQKADAPDADAIPWLLLRAKSNAGEGLFAGVSFIQRVFTQGGKAPATGCDQAHTGSEIRVDYQAEYYFYVPQTS